MTMTVVVGIDLAAATSEEEEVSAVTMVLRLWCRIHASLQLCRMTRIMCQLRCGIREITKEMSRKVVGGLDSKMVAAVWIWQDGDGHAFGGRGGGYNDRGGGGGRFGNNRGRGGDQMEIPTGPRSQQYDAPADSCPPLNKGKVANILPPKKRDAGMVTAPVEAPMTLPGEDEAAARARLEKKRLEDEA
mmetsp:Transcript_23723/g.42662  ORF Transcript_23723/g.42662 Transcript_23723/m.42662 type:complete len:188 (+) Transcript_23723:914-1477(+)